MPPAMRSSRLWPTSPKAWSSPACGGWWSPAAKPPARWWIAWIPGFLVGAEIAAGVPVLRAVGASDGAMLLALKSGNFGGANSSPTRLS